MKNLISRLYELYGDPKEELELARSHHPMSIYSWKVTRNIIFVPGKALQYGLYDHKNKEKAEKSVIQDIVIPSILEFWKAVGYFAAGYKIIDYLLK